MKQGSTCEVSESQLYPLLAARPGVLLHVSVPWVYSLQSGQNNKPSLVRSVYRLNELLLRELCILCRAQQMRYANDYP